MYKAYKFRIYPTIEQQTALAKAFGCARWYWNFALNLCQKTYQATGKGLSRAAIQGLLPNLKKEYPWLTDAYSQCLQVVALNLSRAYQNFFEKRARLPRFKSKHGRQSITYPQNVKFEGDYLKLDQKIGKIYCIRHRELEGTIKNFTISKNPDGKYYASVLVDDGLEPPNQSTDGKAVGIDLGLTHLAITSEGRKYKNSKHFAKNQRNLKRKKQKLSRKQPGSHSHQKSKKIVAKVHSKISRCREDFLHKLSRKIVNENQVIAVENLNLKSMVRPHKFAESISDFGWGMFCTMLKYKAENEGKTYVEIDRFFPSYKTCHVCLNQVASLSLEMRTWTCQQCHTTHDREINAAINIKNEALRMLSLGTSDPANGGSVSRTGKTSVLLDAIPCEVGSPQLH